MTNGVWHRDAGHLEVSADGTATKPASPAKSASAWTSSTALTFAKLAEFCRVARAVFDRDTILSLSYASRAPDQGLEPIRKLAEVLDAVVEWSDLLGRYLMVSDDLTVTMNWNHLAAVERAERLPGNPWDGTWFEEDYCEGPGQALIVNPKGEVKPCCGFASDLDQLTIGNIHTDSVEAIIRIARKHPVVGTIFRKGLSALRDAALAKDPNAFPAATSNHCFFCWYVLTKNLVALPVGFPAAVTNGRVSLPLAGADPALPVARPGDTATALLMAFDGRKVLLGRELSLAMASEKGRVYLVNITGPSPVEPPSVQLTWTEYQSWIDRLRLEGHTLTTHNFSPCQR